MMNKNRLFQQHMTNDDGYIMIATVGALALVTLLAVSSFVIAQSTIRDSTKTADHNRAFQVAASAADQELAMFENMNVREPGVYSDYLPTGEGYSIKYEEENGYYTITTTVTEGDLKESVVVGYREFDAADAMVSAGGDPFQGSAFNTGGTIVIGPMHIRSNETVRLSSGIVFLDGKLNINAFNPKLFENTDENNLAIQNAQFNASKNVRLSDTDYPIFTFNRKAVEKDTPPSPGDSSSYKLPYAVWAGTPFDIVVPSVKDGTFKEDLKNDALNGNGYYHEGDLTIPSEPSSGIPAELTVDEENPSSLLNLSSGTKASPYVIYVDGEVTISASVNRYLGNFIIYSSKGITCQGELLPEGYSPSNVDDVTVETKYLADKYDELFTVTGNSRSASIPKIRVDRCASLVTDGKIWLNGGYRNQTFGFAGVCFADKDISFKGSLRGSIISRGKLLSQVKSIVATQPDLRTSILPIHMDKLLKRVAIQDYWRRESPKPE